MKPEHLLLLGIAGVGLAIIFPIVSLATTQWCKSDFTLGLSTHYGLFKWCTQFECKDYSYVPGISTVASCIIYEMLAFTDSAQQGVMIGKLGYSFFMLPVGSILGLIFVLVIYFADKMLRQPLR